MEDKIEVGEYVRTKYGHIGILKRIELDENDKSLKWYVFDKKEFEINIIKEEYINKPYIVKHSRNIIDLIEVGDYVNRYLVVAISDDGYIEIAIGDDIEQGELLTAKDIKSIVTKEQFKSLEYRIGDSDEKI